MEVKARRFPGAPPTTPACVARYIINFDKSCARQMLCRHAWDKGQRNNGDNLFCTTMAAEFMVAMFFFFCWPIKRFVYADPRSNHRPGQFRIVLALMTPARLPVGGAFAGASELAPTAMMPCGHWRGAQICRLDAGYCAGSRPGVIGVADAGDIFVGARRCSIRAAPA